MVHSVATFIQVIVGLSFFTIIGIGTSFSSIDTTIPENTRRVVNIYLCINIYSIVSTIYPYTRSIVHVQRYTRIKNKRKMFSLKNFEIYKLFVNLI